MNYPRRAAPRLAGRQLGGRLSRTTLMLGGAAASQNRRPLSRRCALHEEDEQLIGLCGLCGSALAGN